MWADQERSVRVETIEGSGIAQHQITRGLDSAKSKFHKLRETKSFIGISQGFFFNANPLQ